MAAPRAGVWAGRGTFMQAPGGGREGAGDLHGAAGDVGVDLHDERVLLGDAATVDDLAGFDAVFLEAVDDRERPEGGRFNQRPIYLRRPRVERLAEQGSGEPRVAQDPAGAG